MEIPARVEAMRTNLGGPFLEILHSCFCHVIALLRKMTFQGQVATISARVRVVVFVIRS